MGHPHGVLQAWRTITGGECSRYFPSGFARYHSNADIPHAFQSCWGVTDNPRHGFEMLVETAHLWLDAGYFSGGQFRIDNVTGPDAYTCTVYTNHDTSKAARHHLRRVCQLARALKNQGTLFAQGKLEVSQGELGQFQEAAGRMFLPFDEAVGICAQDGCFLVKKHPPLSGIPRGNFPLVMCHHPHFLCRHQVLNQAAPY